VFLLDRKVRRASANTLSFYKRQITPFLRWCAAQGVVTLAEIQATHMRAYLLQEQERGFGDRSVDAVARSLRAWLNFAVMEELLDTTPMAKVSMPKLDKRILPASRPDDVRRLLEACTSKRDRAAVLFLLDAGLRVSEFIALNGRHVDVLHGPVRVVRMAAPGVSYLAGNYLPSFLQFSY
jgi:site-specific recombinase XerC